MKLLIDFHEPASSYEIDVPYDQSWIQKEPTAKLLIEIDCVFDSNEGTNCQNTF